MTNKKKKIILHLGMLGGINYHIPGLNLGKEPSIYFFDYENKTGRISDAERVLYDAIFSISNDYEFQFRKNAFRLRRKLMETLETIKEEIVLISARVLSTILEITN